MASTSGTFGFVGKTLAGAGLASASLLGGAHAFEAMGYAPCELCLDQREAHWAALTVALAGLAAAVFLKARQAAAAALGAVSLVYAVSAGLAFYHTGVEFGFWPGPAACAGGGTVDGVIDLGAALSKGASGPSCSEAAWRFLGVSMAGYNLLASALLFALTMAAALGETGADRTGRNGAPMHV